MPKRTRTIASILLAALAVAAVPVLTGAQAPRGALPPHKGSHPSQTRAAWDGKVQGRQVVTALSATFEDEEAFRDFAAGRIPFTLTLRSAASGQTIRIGPELLRQSHYSFRLGANNRAIWVVAIDQLRAPLWDSSGCIDTTTTAESTGGGNGAAITISYAPCASVPAAAHGERYSKYDVANDSRVAARQAAGGGPIRCPGDVLCSVLLGIDGPSARAVGTPIPGIGIVIKKNPGGGAARVVVSGGASEVSEGDQTARLQLVRSGAPVVRASSGEAAPQRQGF
jgi:hypothetical protein